MARRTTGHRPVEQLRWRLDAILAELREAVQETASLPGPEGHRESRP
jgi:hypothetical protein